MGYGRQHPQELRLWYVLDCYHRQRDTVSITTNQASIDSDGASRKYGRFQNGRVSGDALKSRPGLKISMIRAITKRNASRDRVQHQWRRCLRWFRVGSWASWQRTTLEDSRIRIGYARHVSWSVHQKPTRCMEICFDQLGWRLWRSTIETRFARFKIAGNWVMICFVQMGRCNVC